jgi:recombination protein RecA
MTIEIEKLEQLDNLLSKSCKGLYKGFTKSKEDIDLTVVKTGIFSIDLNIGGWPLGRIVEIRGATSSGKTSLSLSLIAKLQQRHYNSLWIDAESVYTDKYARACGVDTERLGVLKPNNMEECLEALRIVTKSGAVHFIWVDSLAALIPSEQEDKDITGGQLGRRAALMSKILPELSRNCGASECSIIWLNQERVGNLSTYGNPNVGTGGKALPYYSSLIIETRKGAYTEDKSIKLGHQCHIKITKSKLLSCLPFTEFDLPLKYFDSNTEEAGIDFIEDLFKVAIQLGAISKAGSYFSFKDKKAQGTSSFIELIKSDNQLFESIFNTTLELYAKKERD